MQMNTEKNKKITNFYWPQLGGEWKVLRSYSQLEDTTQRLSSWDESHYAWNISFTLNDCAAYNSSYLSCLDALEISDIESLEILRIIRSSEESQQEMEVEVVQHNQNESNVYLELMIKDAEILKETLVDAYIKSRYLKWSNSSVESKYNIPVSILSQ